MLLLHHHFWHPEVLLKQEPQNQGQRAKPSPAWISAKKKSKKTKNKGGKSDNEDGEPLKRKPSRKFEKSSTLASFFGLRKKKDEN